MEERFIQAIISDMGYNQLMLLKEMHKMEKRIKILEVEIFGVKSEKELMGDTNGIYRRNRVPADKF